MSEKYDEGSEYSGRGEEIEMAMSEERTKDGQKSERMLPVYKAKSSTARKTKIFIKSGPTSFESSVRKYGIHKIFPKKIE